MKQSSSLPSSDSILSSLHWYEQFSELKVIEEAIRQIRTYIDTLTQNLSYHSCSDGIEHNTHFSSFLQRADASALKRTGAVKAYRNQKHTEKNMDGIVSVDNRTILFDVNSNKLISELRKELFTLAIVLPTAFPEEGHDSFISRSAERLFEDILPAKIVKKGIMIESYIEIIQEDENIIINRFKDCMSALYTPASQGVQLLHCADEYEYADFRQQVINIPKEQSFIISISDGVMESYLRKKGCSDYDIETQMDNPERTFDRLLYNAIVDSSPETSEKLIQSIVNLSIEEKLNDDCGILVYEV